MARNRSRGGRRPLRRAVPTGVAALTLADVLAGIAAKVLATHSGAARVVEQERRAGQETQETLDNGVVVSWRWIPGEVAVAAVAFGGLEPGAGRSAARSVAKVRWGEYLRPAEIKGKHVAQRSMARIRLAKGSMRRVSLFTKRLLSLYGHFWCCVKYRNGGRLCPLRESIIVDPSKKGKRQPADYLFDVFVDSSSYV